MRVGEFVAMLTVAAIASFGIVRLIQWLPA